MKLFSSLVGLAAAQWDPNYHPGHGGMVHLFEWHWDWIANECEAFLGPKRWGGVQISPPNENRVIGNRPWWERYQPISYNLETRSGSRGAFADMVSRCNNAGVRIYADALPNHMCGGGGSGEGTGGSYFDANSLDFPSVPYSASDMNDGNCYSGSGNIENYGDPNQVRNCRLVNLIDLNQGKDYVRGKIGGFMGDVINLGAAGFRVDACKHMWPGDLEVIYSSLPNLSRGHGFRAGGRPFIAQEVIDQGGEPITAGEYTGIGRVTEFKYCFGVGENVHSLGSLESIGPAWGYMGPMSALVFVNNHDNQRGHGGGGTVITFEQPWELKLLTVFMMAHDYGEPRVMSSYYFSDTDEGPPWGEPNGGNGDCGNGWVCEHRWKAIGNMGMFRGSVHGTGVEKWNNGGNNQIAFSRGNKGFVAINGGSGTWSGSIPTSMPNGEYCDLLQGEPTDGGCMGPTITVSGGSANINVPTGDVPMSAISIDYPASGCDGNCGGGGTPPDGGGGSGECESCNCSNKKDCGSFDTTESSCEASGCLWCPVSLTGETKGEPWCIYGSSSGGGDGGQSCSVPDSNKRDCGQMGTTEQMCGALGCCWSESQTGGVPWCFFPQ